MRTFTQLKSDYLILTHDNSTANSTLGPILINRYIKKILMMRDFTWNRSSKDITGVADQQAYPLPYNLERVKNVKVAVTASASTMYYFPKEVTSREIWTKLNRTTVSGNQTSRYFIEDDAIEVYPVFSSATPVMTVYFQKTNKDLAATDYTTGSAYTTSASPTYVTASPSSVAWSSPMIGRFIQFEDDGFWYEIDNVVSTTSLRIKRGASIPMDWSDYTISELMPLPYGYQDLPLWFALATYFQGRKDQIPQAREYERMAKEGLEQLLRRDAKSVGTLLTKSDLEEITGLYDINQFPEDIS